MTNNSTATSDHKGLRFGVGDKVSVYRGGKWMDATVVTIDPTDTAKPYYVELSAEEGNYWPACYDVSGPGRSGTVKFEASELATLVKETATLPPVPPDWRMRYDDSSARRKDQPVTEGFLKYCPAAIRLAAELSRLGNEKHNPGEPMHHARGKSADHLDCAARHIMDADKVDGDTGLIEAVLAFWRLGMYIQEKCERDYGWPKAPNAK